MDDQGPVYNYERERRDHRIKVTVGIASVLLGVVVLVLRFALVRSTEYTPPVMPVLDPPVRTEVPYIAPIEFQLAIGPDAYDVVPDRPIHLKAGGQIELEPTPLWVANGDGFHVKHETSVSVSPSTEMLIASVDGAVAKLQPLDAKLSDAEAKKLVASMVTITGQAIGEPRPVTREIAGKSQAGLEYTTTTTMVVETFLVALDKRRLAVLLYRQDPKADIARLERLLASLAAGEGAPTAYFTVKGATRTPLFVDKPADVALDKPTTVTLKRRARVLRTFAANGGQLTFEYPYGVSVNRMPNDAMLAVSIQSDRAGVQLFDLQMHFSLDELKRALLGAIRATDLGEVKRGTLIGRKLKLEQMPVMTEIYVFERNGKSIGATIQYVAEDEQAATDLAVPIMMSVR